MLDEKKREAAESVFRDDSGGRPGGLDALSQEAARRASIIKNMYRLRALRLANSRQEHGASA
jgi:hypothetical protein